jgi:predicted metalloprotease
LVHPPNPAPVEESDDAKWLLHHLCPSGTFSYTPPGRDLLAFSSQASGFAPTARGPVYCQAQDQVYLFHESLIVS